MNNNLQILNQINALEMLIMEYYMDGKKYYEIANILHISKKSVSANIKSVISKLKAKNAIHSAVILTKILKNLNPL